MKVFEVITEDCEGDRDSTKITKTVQYVTCNTDSILDVTDYFSRECEQFEKDLIGVKEVITIVQNIEIGEA